MKKRCIVISKDFNHVSPLRKYWDDYANPNRKVMAMQFGGDFHKELLVQKGKLRTIGAPLLPGTVVERNVQEGYHYVDGARLCDVENPLNFPDSVFISERDGWIEGVMDSEAYLRGFESDMVILVVHIEKLTRMAQKA